MASGTISLGTSNQIKGRIKWSSNTNGISANSSDVTAIIQVKRTNSYTTTGTWKGSLSIGGTKKSFSKYKDVSDSWVTLLSFSQTIAHNPDGTGSCELSGVINGPSGTSQEDSKVSEKKTVSLDRIARCATLTSVENFTDEENAVISYSKGAGSELESLTLGITANGSDDIISREISKTGSSSTVEFTNAERELLLELTRNSNVLPLTFVLRSRLSGADYESQKTANMTVVDAMPTISAIARDVNPSTLTVTGDDNILVAGYSQAEVTVDAKAYKGANVENILIVNGSKELSGNGILTPVQNAPIRVKVTDSRRNTAVQELANAILPYTSPNCFVENAVLSGEGKMLVAVSGKFYNEAIGKTENSLRVQCRVKAADSEYGEWIDMDVSLSGNTYDAGVQLEGLDYKKNHTLQARAADAITTKISDEVQVVSTPVFDWGQDDFAFNVPVKVQGVDILKELQNIKNGTTSGAVPAPMNATAGQYIRVKTVDSDGVVLSTEAVTQPTIVPLTQAEYDALPDKDATVLYMIVRDD